MKILVCIKQVLDARVPLKINGVVKQTVRSPVYIANPSDRIALQKAVELGNFVKSAEIIAVTVGPHRAEQVLEIAIGGGADKAIHLITDKDQDLCDPFTTAYRLSKIFNTVGFNLVLCGNMSLDNCAAQVHAFLAELLGIPRVTGVVKLEFTTENRAKLWRRLEKGRRQVLECRLPALFTIDPLAGYPRYVSEFNLMDAAKKQIRRLTLSDIGLAQTEVDPQAATVKVVGLSPAKPRTKKIFIPDSSMSMAHRMNSFLYGRSNSETKQSNLLVGTADFLSSQIIEYLTKEGITQR